MTKITLRETAEGWLFDCEGHANFGEAGRDIVCAGVSALCMALLRRLEEMSCEGLVRTEGVHVAPGEVHLRVRADPADPLAALLLQYTFAAVMAGFAAIEERYGEYVSIE